MSWSTSPTIGWQPNNGVPAPQRGTRVAVGCQPHNGVPAPQRATRVAVGCQPHKGVPAPQRGTRVAVGYQGCRGVPAPQWDASPTCGTLHSPVPAAGEDQFPLFHECPRSQRRLSCFRSVFGAALVGILSRVPRAQAPPGWRLHLNKFYFLLRAEASPQPAGSGSAPLPDPQTGWNDSSGGPHLSPRLSPRASHLIPLCHPIL